jgi:hypothetical protein
MPILGYAVTRSLSPKDLEELVFVGKESVKVGGVPALISVGDGLMH